MTTSTPSSSSGRYDLKTVLRRSRLSASNFSGEGKATYFKCALIMRSVIEPAKAGESVGVPQRGSRKYFVTASVSLKGISRSLMGGGGTIPVC